ATRGFSERNRILVKEAKQQELAKPRLKARPVSNILKSSVARTISLNMVHEGAMTLRNNLQ
ncbi:MAG: hypothetical protein FWF69_09625, partial [Firmicutes bacterium]|nr:hypothetical protein [Bacillota bacterium]